MSGHVKSLKEIARENDAYREPCLEFLKFRKMLDVAGVPWQDASSDDPYFIMHRTHGKGFSVIWGRGSYGREEGLLEAKIEGVPDVTGYLTAAEAFKMVKEHCL